MGLTQKIMYIILARARRNSSTHFHQYYMYVCNQYEFVCNVRSEAHLRDHSLDISNPLE